MLPLPAALPGSLAGGSAGGEIRCDRRCGDRDGEVRGGASVLPVGAKAGSVWRFPATLRTMGAGRSGRRRTPAGVQRMTREGSAREGGERASAIGTTVDLCAPSIATILADLLPLTRRTQTL